MIIPTSYGRNGDYLYIHGSSKSFMLNQILKNQNICISVTQLDGIVLARTLFDTSVNYRFCNYVWKGQLIENQDEKLKD